MAFGSCLAVSEPIDRYKTGTNSEEITLSYQDFGFSSQTWKFSTGGSL